MEAITDWDDAYTNGAYIPGSEGYVPRWTAEAAAFRSTHPARDGVFWPEGEPRGLLVFIHGGYWMKFGPESFSHLAAGPLARGWAVAMPGYPLAPSARIAEMTRVVAERIAAAAAQVAGPLVVTGHSAGGHLAARMICDDAPLGDLTARVTRCVPISGLFDLRPLLRTAMLPTLRLDEAEALAESPALRAPLPGIPVTAWVGADERPEFLRHSALLANIWRGLGAATTLVEEAGRHHFDIIEGLTDARAALTEALLA